MLSDTTHGAKASAALYSLIETAKANGVEPYAYLKHVFTEIPKAGSGEGITALLPWEYKRNILRNDRGKIGLLGFNRMTLQGFICFF